MWITLKLRLLTLFFVMNCLLPAISFAQDSAAESSTDQAAAVGITKNIAPTKSSAAVRDSFARDKEQRLEDLRYKHLWIAYSLVWVVIFLFIRRTWQRSQEVTGRLDELKRRLIALEEEES